MMLHKNPRDESVARDVSSCPNNLAPGHSAAPYEPMIPVANFETRMALQIPHMRGGAPNLE